MLLSGADSYMEAKDNENFWTFVTFVIIIMFRNMNHDACPFQFCSNKINLKMSLIDYIASSQS